LDDYPTSDYWYNETTTRLTIVNPMIESLGWDLYDLYQCGYEIDPKGEEWGKKPADYVLGAPSGRSVVVIEAKRFDLALGTADQEQLAGYIDGLPSGYAVLTNGDVWRVYNLRKHGDFPDKSVCEVSILSDAIQTTARTLHELLGAHKWWD
jgi:predicted type IV restriction endonuclease